MAGLRNAFSTKGIDVASVHDALDRWLNRELIPSVAEIRARLNELLIALVLPGYPQGQEPTVVGAALVMNTTTGRPRFTANSGATWTDL